MAEQPPPLCPGNPGIGSVATLMLVRGEQSWSEQVDLVHLGGEVLTRQGYSVVTEKTWLLHPESGYILQPQLVLVQPLDAGGVRTVTTVQVNHPTLAPRGVFEYQHSTGNTLAEAIAWGLEQWLQTDFVPLLEALRPKPERCMTLEMAFPARDGQLGRTRRVILGPVAHFMEKPPAKSGDEPAEEHPFCNCCLLTRSFEAFRHFIEGNDLFCLRLFAMRNADGIAQADCRVNGEDWDPGAQALQEYVHTWPAAGFEFRKQYVVIYTVAEDARLGPAGD